MSQAIRPMLAAKLDMDAVRYPVLASPKVDGIRAIISNGRPMSRTWKEIPNRHLRALVRNAGDVLELADGELVAGSPSAPDVYNASMSGLMSESGTPDIQFLVFDSLHDMTAPYEHRLASLTALSLPSWCTLLPQWRITGRDELEAFEEGAIRAGYEGIIVRAPRAPYKQGRSTVNQGWLLKLKRYDDSEAVVTGTAELMHNDNQPWTDVQGHTARTSHKDGQRPGGKLGSLAVTAGGIAFSIGTGFSDDERARLWAMRDQLPGAIVKFRHLPHGQLDAPRHPVFLGFRDASDMQD